jgi:hypothetical protein
MKIGVPIMPQDGASDMNRPKEREEQKQKKIPHLYDRFCQITR